MSENQKQSVEGWSEKIAIHIANWFRFFVDKDNHVKPEGIKELQGVLERLLSQQQLEVVEKVKEMLKNPKHKVGTGGYCDTGEDMEWTCRSECTKLILDDILQSLSTLTTLNNK